MDVTIVLFTVVVIVAIAMILDRQGIIIAISITTHKQREQVEHEQREQREQHEQREQREQRKQVEYTAWMDETHAQLIAYVRAEGDELEAEIAMLKTIASYNRRPLTQAEAYELELDVAAPKRDRPKAQGSSSHCQRSSRKQNAQRWVNRIPTI